MANTSGKSGAPGKPASGSGSGAKASSTSTPKSKASPKSSPKARPTGGATSKATSKTHSPSKAQPKPKSGTKPASKSPRKSTASGATSRRRLPTVRPNGATVLVAIVVILGIAVLAPTAQRYIAQRQYVAQLQAELAETQKSVDEIATERDRWSDPAYIQSQARGRLLFVMPGDTSYLVLDPPATNKQQQSNISTELHETQSSWLDSFVESLVTAGTAPAPTPSD
ncbi:septum formation initiator family protein [Pseudoclavibacter sp. AY1F1]|uniref:FtsB family cell division protein n=1 Tax=Pseudoclavibacter sp. AY1F1 TaxID=2080583 RepID=UPI0015E32484|nr:septum formation initiator family protein [Pseudoclavibacter sp. AY1F1]